MRSPADAPCASTSSTPTGCAEQTADVGPCLARLVVGHSWGGHLALHAAVALPQRLLGVLAVDPLGAVGDGGAAEFGAELLNRVPAASRNRADELSALDDAGRASLQEQLELLEIVWPSYYATPQVAPPPPRLRIAEHASLGLWGVLVARLPGLEGSLASITVPVGILSGARSPMPPQVAAVESARRIPGAWVVLEPDAGHFTWQERPGCVVAALGRLAGETAPT